MTTELNDPAVGAIPIAPPPTDNGEALAESTARQPGPPPRKPRKGTAKRRRQKRKRSFRWLTLLVLLPIFLVGGYLAAGYLLVPYLLTDLLPAHISAASHRSCTIGTADFDPIKLRLSLANGIMGPDDTDPRPAADPLLSFSRCVLRLDYKALLHGRLAIRQLQLEQPFFHLIRRQDRSYNIAIAPFTPQNKPITDSLWATMRALPITVSGLEIRDGRFILDDKTTGKRHNVEHIMFTLPVVHAAGGNISTQQLLSRNQLKPSFSASINGSPISLSGDSTATPTGMTTSLNLHLTRLSLPEYAAYFPLPVTLLTGRADCNLTLSYTADASRLNGLSIAGDCSLQDLRLQEQSGGTESAITALSLAGRLLPANRQLTLTNLAVSGAKLHVQRNNDATFGYSLQPLIASLFAPSPASTDGPTPRWQASIENLTLSDSTITFQDRTAVNGFSSRWQNVALRLRNITTMPNAPPVPVTLTADSQHGSHIAFQGKLSSAQGNAVTGLLVADQVILNTLPTSYLPYTAPYRITAGEVTRGKASINWQPATNQFAISDLTLEARQLVVKGPAGAELLMPSLSISRTQITPSHRVLEAGRVAIPELSWHLPPPQAATDNKPANQATEVWHYTLRDLAVAKATLTIPRTGHKPLSLRLNDLQGINLGNLAQSQGRVIAAGRLEGNTALQCAGPMTLEPFTADLQCTIDRLPLASGILDGVLPFSLPSGVLQASGRFRWPNLSFSGTAGISSLVVKQGAETVFSWHQAIAEKVHLTSNPTTLSINQLTVDRPRLALRLTGGGDTNLTPFFSQPTTDGKKTSLDVETISITRGTLHLTDSSVSPPYQGEMHDISGSILHFTNRPQERSHFSLEGLGPANGPITFTGDMGLFAPLLYADFNARAERLPLSSLTSYFATSLGKGITGGELTIDSNYHQENGAVSADNQLILRDLQLSAHPDLITHLPLTLALLTDPDGTVTLSLPVRGSRAQKGYTFHNALLTGVKNLLLKTAVTPFSLLGNLITATTSSQLDHLTFAYGSADLSRENRDKLKELYRVLTNRPWLKIQLAGLADATGDRQAIVAARRQALARQQLEREHQLSQQLSQGYGSEEITQHVLPRPTATPPVSVTVPDSQLLTLARQRAQNAIDYLRQLGLEQKRVADPVTPRLVPASSAARSGNRVDFKLLPLWGH